MHRWNLLSCFLYVIEHFLKGYFFSQIMCYHKICCFICGNAYMIVLSVFRITSPAGTLVLCKLFLAFENFFVILYRKKFRTILYRIISRTNLTQSMNTLFHKIMHGFLDTGSKIILVEGETIFLHPVGVILQIRPQSAAGRHNRLARSFIIENISAEIAFLQLFLYILLVHTKLPDKGVRHHMIPKIRCPVRIRKGHKNFGTFRTHLMCKKPRHIARILNARFDFTGQIHKNRIYFFVKNRINFIE